MNTSEIIPLVRAFSKAPADAQVTTAVAAWLDDHPEATTTVEDGSITNAKLATSFVTPGTASAYSSSATYAVGDYVFYNGDLYRCTTPITTAETWTAAHWTEAVLGNDVAGLKNAIGNFRWSKTAVSRFIDIPISVEAGDVLFFKPITWTGDAATHYTMTGIKNGVYTTLTTVASLGDETYYTATASQNSIRVSANTAAAPSTTQTFTVLLANIKNLNDIAQIALKNKKDIQTLNPLLSSSYNIKGFFTGTTLLNANTTGAWLLVSAYVSGLTDAPAGLSGDYLLVVNKFSNGYVQELISLLNAGEHHIRFSAGTATWPWHSIAHEHINIALFGDSITKGQIGGTSPAQYTDSGFVRAARSKGYTIANYGIGAIGYSYTVDSHNALYEITNADLSGTDIVILSFGVNDWQNNVPLGSVDDSTISTMCGGLNLALAKIIEKKPTATIIVFSPLNCTFKGGTEAGKWALGHSLPTSGTLEDVFDAIKAVCEKHEVAFVDMTHGNPAVNCMNANNSYVLGDGLHPTELTYKHLGRVIANYI